MSKEADARAAWGAMFQVFLGAQKPRFQDLAAEAGVTVRTIHALLDLAPDEPQPMSVLAERWFCDASNVTGIVDSLERTGLAVREAHPGDRRVRMVRLTDEGVAVRERCIAQLSDPPASLLRLSAEELQALRPLVEKAAQHQPPVV